jgi:hypothetical protein
VGNIYNYGIYYIMPACNGLDLACEPVSHEIYKDGGGIFYWKKSLSVTG